MIYDKLNPVREKRDIPNQKGFTLHLIDGDGGLTLATVSIDENGCHYCADINGNKLYLPNYLGWKPIAKKG